MATKPHQLAKRRTRSSARMVAVISGVLCTIGGVRTRSAAAAAPVAPIFDYHVRFLANYEPGGGYDDVDPAPGVIQLAPFAGFDYASDGPTYYPITNTYKYQYQQNSPVALFLINQTLAPDSGAAPSSSSYGANTLPDTISWFDSNNLPLNYVMSDYEPYNGNTAADVTAQVDSTVNAVRAATNANVQSAFVGNYADYDDGTSDSITTLFLNSGLNLAMPNAYPYSNYQTVSGNANARSALFWTPLNMITVAKTNLPAGDQLIPWLSSYINKSGYTYAPPTVEDNVAIIADTRLRGADGYYNLGSGPNNMSSYSFAWSDLNWVFNGTGTAKILTASVTGQGLNQSSGFQWSGYANGTNAAFMFDNLGNAAASVALPTMTGVPASSPTVAVGTHTEVFYANDPAHLGSDTIYLGRVNINSSLYSNATVSVSNPIVLPAASTGDSPMVTIGSDLAGSDTPTFAGSISLSDNVTLQSAASSTTFSGVISGAALVTTIGPQKIVLSGPNTYSGGTNISSGALLATNSNALGTGTVAILDGATSTASLQLSGGITINNTFAGFSSEIASATPTVENISGNNTVTSPLSITTTGGNGAIFQSDAGTLNLSGGLTTTLPSTRDYYLQGAGNGIVAGNITDDSSKILAVVKNGTGTWTLIGQNTYADGTSVNAGTLVFGSPSALTAFSKLTISAGTAMAANHGTAAKNALFLSSLTIAGTTGAWTGTLDLTNNDLVVRNGSLGTLTAQVRQGYNAAGHTWQGSGGILSSTAAGDTTHLTALGVIQNSTNGNPTGAVLYPGFDGQITANSDVLVKYTYYGDANLDGKVDASDYSLIDSAYLTGATGWFNGDFNYDGVINGSDYTLIDNTFNSQGARITDVLAIPTAEIAPVTAVPEPVSSALAVVGGLALLLRKRKPC